VIKFRQSSRDFLLDGPNYPQRHCDIPPSCCRVGDMIKFGQSTRDFLLDGPAELMPHEGPSKAQRMEARLLKVIET